MSARGIERTGWQGEGPDRDRHIVSLAGKVATMSMVFYFGGVLFSFVYLRVQDVNGRWTRPDVRPSTTLAVVVLGATVLAGLGTLRLRGEHRRGELRSWRTVGRASQVLIFVAIVVRIAQLWTMPAQPDDAAYVAVLIGWSASLVAVSIAASYWLQTLAARAHRLAVDVGQDDAYRAARRRFEASASAFIVFWWVIVLVELVAFLLLQVVG